MSEERVLIIAQNARGGIEPLRVRITSLPGPRSPLEKRARMHCRILGFEFVQLGE